MSDDPSVSFEEAFQLAASQTGWRTRLTPGTAVERWRYFTDDCLAGYPWDVERYANDLTLRSTLRGTVGLLGAEHSEHVAELSGTIDAIDSELRSVLAREVFTRFPEDEWWLRNAPLYAGRQFCEDFAAAYAVRIPERSQYDDEIDAMRSRVADGRNRAAVCVSVKTEEWRVARRPDLLFHACKTALALADRQQRRLLWSWATGGISDEQLASELL